MLFKVFRIKLHIPSVTSDCYMGSIINKKKIYWIKETPNGESAERAILNYNLSILILNYL